MENFTDKPSGKTNESLTKSEAYAAIHSQIKGWGIDANPKNDPTYPMRNRKNERTKNDEWQRPPLQKATTETLHSNERPNLTATFGTSAPLTGLSGKLRRFAFRYSEGKFIHWLALLLADRVNVIEGVAADMARGKVPNLINERGTRAEWKHNPNAVVKKAVLGLAVVTSLVLIFKLKQKK